MNAVLLVKSNALSAMDHGLWTLFPPCSISSPLSVTKEKSLHLSGNLTIVNSTDI